MDYEAALSNAITEEAARLDLVAELDTLEGDETIVSVCCRNAAGEKFYLNASIRVDQAGAVTLPEFTVIPAAQA